MGKMDIFITGSAIRSWW